ncbi:unnamed protein product [Linum tenue]|uniref:Ribonuclease H2 subunit B n=1 Tax=Linum tenue TaxID=586396 RepID=A0AAV0IEX5_9ROSI|nr:unnamed protein product [Linum tenue]
MAWWKGIDETRLLVAPDPAGNETGSGCLLSLRHPKSGNKACYRLASGGLQELHLFKQSYRSWFLGDYVCEDGGIYFATSVDPVFILLPIFEEARMKKGDDLGKFRPLDEIIFIDGYPGYHQLMSIAENCMGVVCEIKAIGSSKFFRLDDSKVLAWLHCKVSQLKQTFPSLDEKYASMDEQTTLSESVKIVGEYVKDEPWLKLLCKRLKIDLMESTKTGPDFESSLASKESKLLQQRCDSFQEGSGNKAKRGGKQAKKPKLETQSRNIKDMFSKKKS